MTYIDLSQLPEDHPLRNSADPTYSDSAQQPAESATTSARCVVVPLEEAILAESLLWSYVDNSNVEIARKAHRLSDRFHGYIKAAAPAAQAPNRNDILEEIAGRTRLRFFADESRAWVITDTEIRAMKRIGERSSE